MRRFGAYLVVGLLSVTGRPAMAQQVRVMQWNVHGHIGNVLSNSTPQAQALARIVNYNQPDILLFNELEYRSVFSNTLALIQWVTNNVPYLGQQTGVTFWVAVSSLGDGFEKNGAISRYPILSSTNYDIGPRGLHSLQVQLTGTNQLQVFQAHFKCCTDTGTVVGAACTNRQVEAQQAATVISNWAAANSRPYIFAGDWNESEDPRDTPLCALTAAYHPISTVIQTAQLADFVPTTLSGQWRTWGTSLPSIRFDYLLAASNRLNAVTGYVFSSVDWATHGLYTNTIPGSLTNDSALASDHFCVFVDYLFPAGGPGLLVTPATGFVSAGNQGGVFTPTQQTYRVYNTGTNSVAWAAASGAAWLEVEPAMGTLEMGAATNVVATLNSTVSALVDGDYLEAVTFTNLSTATGGTTRPVTLTVYPTSGSALFHDVENGTNGWTVSGLWHIVGTTGCVNAFSPTRAWWYGVDATCTYSNGAINTGDLISPAFVVPAGGTLTYRSWEETEGTSTNWDRRVTFITTNNAVSWVPLIQSTNNAASWYPVAIGLGPFAGKTAKVRFHFNTGSSLFNNYGGWYLDDIRVAGPPVLVVTSAGSVAAVGEEGGPFAPGTQVYALTNAGGRALSWTAGVASNWLSVSSSDGILAGGGTTNLSVSTNAMTTVLPGGLYSNVVGIVNATTGAGNTNPVWVLLVRDGVADAWRLQYFGHVDPQAGDLSRAQDDRDGDGLSNLAEYLFGTVPTNAGSAFGLEIRALNSAAMEVSFGSLTGRGYTLEFRNNLTVDGWQALPEVAGTGTRISLTNAVAPPTRSYRLRVR